MLRLKDVRTARGISQKELAIILGIGASSLSQYENGSRQPGFDILIKIADYFGVTTDYLLGRDTKTPPDMDGATPRDETEREFIRLLRDSDAVHRHLAEEILLASVRNETKAKSKTPRTSDASQATVDA